MNTRELWFMPVSNPDGYDFTFTPGNRLWRKNLRDNNGDGQITIGDGVDPNRNFATQWNYDKEGSSDDPASDTYRGPSPGSEPETKAMDGLQRRIGFEFQVNYHSFGPLILYPLGLPGGHRCGRRPDLRGAVRYRREAAIEGYDPDLSAELYTTNGETIDHVHGKYGRSAGRLRSRTRAATAAGGSCSPTTRTLIQAEFEKNMPFALDAARSAARPGPAEVAPGQQGARLPG